MKKNVIDNLRLRFSSFLCICIFFTLITATATQTIFASSETNVRQTEYKADQSLKSNARVNPSTLAMELSIPLGGYRGRGGGLPIIFDYSSKIWQIYAWPTSSWESDYGIMTDVTPLFGHKTAAGWTSNLGSPRIDWELGVYEGLTGGSSYDGQSYAPVLFMDPGQQPQLYYLYYVKRVQVTMPDGSTHEFRKDDKLYGYGTSSNSVPPT